MSHQIEREAVVSKPKLEISERARNRFDDVKKDLEISGASDSGYMSAPTLNSYSDIGHSCSDIDIGSKFDEPSSVGDQKKTTPPSSNNFGLKESTREDEDSSYFSQQSISNNMYIESEVAQKFSEVHLEDCNDLDVIKPKSHSRDELVEIAFSQDEDGDTQLHISISTEDHELSKAIISLAPGPNYLDIQNDDARTPMHLATIYGQSEIVRHLRIAGAEGSIRDRDGSTALHLACQNGDLSTVKSLTQPINVNEITAQMGGTKQKYPCGSSPDVEQKNYLGEKCVHIAAEKNHLDILKHLYCIGADINAREGRSGYTPLHIAVQSNNVEMVEYLLNECKRINVETPTYGCLTAYQMAHASGHKSIKEMLEKSDCDTTSPPSSDYEDSDDESDYSDSDDSTKNGDSSGADD